MMGRSGLELARASYREISLYAPDRTPCTVDLSDNTNLWGVPPAATRAVHEAAAATFTRYPALYASTLKEALARYAGVDPTEVVTGCGSDDVLDSAIRAVAEPGECVAYPDPSFAMVPIFARMNGLQGIGIPLTSAGDLDPDALVATGARVIYLCSPNNPTGTRIPDATIERVIERAPGVVILDEAYAEFMDGSEGFLSRAPSYGNLLVTRTLSKAFGLAGLRIGYATGSRALVGKVEKSRGPYKVNALAERAAVAALTHDMDWVGARIAEVRANRDRLTAALTALDLAPLPSAANFVLVPVRNAVALSRRMRDAGVAVRPFEALTGIGDALRITIGPWSLMEAALAALEEALRCG